MLCFYLDLSGPTVFHIWTNLDLARPVVSLFEPIYICCVLIWTYLDLLFPCLDLLDLLCLYQDLSGTVVSLLEPCTWCNFIWFYLNLL